MSVGNQIRRSVIGVVLLLLCFVFSFTVAASEEAKEPVSLGLMHFAAATDMSVAGKVGEVYYFDEEIFCRGMNLSAVEYITVERLPDGSEGALYLGNSTVTAGQVISSGNLSRLSYVPAVKEKGVGSFTFSCGKNGYAVECYVYTVSDYGAVPTLSYAPEAMLSVSTYRELSFSGILSGYDPDGDSLVFEIVKYPSHGAVRMLDRKEGSYVYTPDVGYTGEDSFRYVVRDRYGNYSESKEVSLTVESLTETIEYADLDDDTLKSAAITVEAVGIMSGVTVGGERFFYPDNAVSRVDFLVMAMKSVGITVDDADADTVFADNDSIPVSLRGYVKAAYDAEIVSGVLGKNGLYFEPDRAVTRAEAAKILSGLMKSAETVSAPLKEPAAMAVSVTVFADMTSIPAWAESAIYHLSSHGIFRAAEGKAAVGESLTRGEAAEIFRTLLELLKDA